MNTTTRWTALAVPDDGKREAWGSIRDRGRWEACGVRWDAVVIHPLVLGLRALDHLRVDPGVGCPVLADHVRDRLCVLVTPRCFPHQTLPGIRVLSDGMHLSVPTTSTGAPAADWLSAPRVEAPRSYRRTCCSAL
ncbi:hypothetical protein [Streptomyces sp. NPDC037389]|uniref:hypothetical protein n=1 Tax=Streptomyces sp. NPDC037389 TaxID=3155369 RepID=UPI0034100701